jgi:hypothetical protein
MAARLKRLKLDWSETLAAVGPDGTQYMIQTESPLHERRLHYPLLRRPGQTRAVTASNLFGEDAMPSEREVFPRGFTETKAQAIRWCEVDAYQRQG